MILPRPTSIVIDVVVWGRLVLVKGNALTVTAAVYVVEAFNENAPIVMVLGVRDVDTMLLT